ncbi:MAG: hypothetical protein JWO06_2067 [Bacteroidota bacterium]|nr:hypothetical protein [Bacteroidota bacterium]
MLKLFISSFGLLVINAGLFAQTNLDSLVNYDSLALKVAANQPAYQTLSERAKLVWDDGTSEQDFQANIRTLKDSLVWMSLTGAMGIEGARILATKDSFRLINKMAAEYASRDFSFLSDWLLFPVSFKMLQQILAGGQISINERASVALYKDSMYVIYNENEKMLEKIWVNTGNYTITKILLKDKMLAQEMSITFDRYSELNGKPFSYNRVIDVNREGVKLKLSIDINKARLNEDLSYPFEVSEKYKRVH